MPTSRDEMKPYRELELPGAELFVAHAGRRASGVLRAGGHEFNGAAAFERGRAAAKDEPLALAHLAMLFLDDNVAGRVPWSVDETGSVPPEELSIAKEPQLRDGMLEYWRRHEQMAGLVRCRVTLADSTISCELGSQIVYDAELAADPMAVIERDLQDDGTAYERGIAALERLDTAAANARLTDVALNHQNFRARAVAAKALTTKPGAEVTEALARVLLFDYYEETRRVAAVALGERGDPAARDALVKARDGDASGRVQGAATHALTQLPK